MIEAFADLVRDRYKTINEWKEREGRKVIGWLCTYVPEEIIYAAGMHPVRVLGGAQETPKADAYLYSNICSFARSCLEEGFEGNYDFMDGLVAVNSCDHIRRLFDVWGTYLQTPYKHILSLPHKVHEDSLRFFARELDRFKESMEDFFGVSVSEHSLREAIQTYNRTRTLLKQLYDLRALDEPPITGSETMTVVLAGMILPREGYNSMLEELLEWLPTRDERFTGEARLLVSGSELDNPEYIKIIEDLGAIVVADDLCVGSRYFWDPAETDGDPMMCLATRYLSRAPCARMRPSTKRIEFIRDMISQFEVDGIVYETIKFCDLYGQDFPLLRDGLEDLNIPLLSLDREYSLAGVGQMKTRVEAFLENIV